MSRRIDLLLIDAEPHGRMSPGFANVSCLLDSSVETVNRELKIRKTVGDADFILLWDAGFPLPDLGTLDRLIAEGLDVAHAGRVEDRDLMPDLAFLKYDWSMVSGSANTRSTSWRVDLRACLIRKQLLIRLGGLDEAYETLAGAGLDFGYRAMAAGGLVEHRPEFITWSGMTNRRRTDPVEFYIFVSRHFGIQWLRYAFLRRAMQSRRFVREINAYVRATKRCRFTSRPAETASARLNQVVSTANRFSGVRVSAVIPTLDRYQYLPNAIESLLRQTVVPAEIVVVDQNPPSQRRYDIYAAYASHGVRVIWQDERGQSLARNTALTEVNCPYTLFFDDDSVARNDLIEAHLRCLFDGRFDVSTGVSVPPPPTTYQLPANFRAHRIAQTLDTGNCLIRTDLVRRLNGFDRNYDFGPGADADFGTRLYLHGARILHNPDAVRIHYKALSGGLRSHGSYKTNTDTGLLDPFPPVTQSYYAMRFFTPFQQREAALLSLFTCKFPSELRKRGAFLDKCLAFAALITALMLAPIKWRKSRKMAIKMLRNGVRLMDGLQSEGSASYRRVRTVT